MDFDTIGQTIFSSLANGTLYAFIGLGFGIVNRSTGVINFAQGDFVMLGAIFTAVLARAGVPVGVAAALAVVACAAIGGAFYLLALRPARRASTGQLVLITIGFSIFLRGAVTTVWGSDPLPVPPFTGGRPLDVMGPCAVKDMLFTGRLIAGVEAHALGIVNRLVPAAGIEPAVRALAAELAANAPLTLRATKEMIRRILAKRRLTPGDDADMVEMCYTSADFREGVTSFLAKRKASWSGS